jgi:hypothetical protein
MSLLGGGVSSVMRRAACGFDGVYRLFIGGVVFEGFTTVPSISFRGVGIWYIEHGLCDIPKDQAVLACRRCILHMKRR